jgi:16S rRNA (cytosine967-C5)-methyltransferase
MPRPALPPGRDLNARGLALRVLLDCCPGADFVQEILHRRLDESALVPPDRRLAAQLAYGVLRRRATLEALLRPVCSRLPAHVHPVVWDILRLGAFQLALMTHIPPHAALFETVELAGTFGFPSARGFVNGVLRGVTRLLTDEAAAGPAADALPLERGLFRRLARAVLPDPPTHPVQYVAAGFALPRWLVRRWLERLGWEESLRRAFWFVGPPAVCLRSNLLKTSRAACLEALRQAGRAAEPGDHPQSIRLDEPAAIRQLPGYEEGWFAVQDEAGMRVGSALHPAPGSRVLDLCAAPGGKTTHLAELMHNQGRIVACDVDDQRLATLTTLCGRLGVTIVEPHRLHPERNEDPPEGPFDAALVDVPCSNTGVLGRRPEVRWRLRPEDFRTLVPLQTRLLIQTVERVRPGGRVVYSTCSIEPEENAQVVRAVLQAFPELELEAEEQQTPGQPSDGGYWARLTRKG